MPPRCAAPIGCRLTPPGRCAPARAPARRLSPPPPESTAPEWPIVRLSALLACPCTKTYQWALEKYRTIYEMTSNVFASYLLMPLDDFRRQIDSRTEVDLEMLGGCARRYSVS